MPLAAFAFTLLAVLLWSILGYIGMSMTEVPALLTTGLSLTMSGIVFALFSFRQWRSVPLRTWLVGIGGIFGYHTLYFSAFQNAPAVEVNLINYLWPLFIVVFTPIIFRESKLQPNHIAGAILGFSGAALIATGGRWSLDLAALPGYLMATTAAVIWAFYSLLTKKLPPFPSTLVGGFCLVSGLLSLLIFGMQGGDLSQAARLPASDWLMITLAAAGPLGAAFLFWDMALKRGDSRIIGSLAYLIPLLSTALIVVAGGKQMSVVSAIAMGLIIGGAMLGSLGAIPLRKRGQHV